MATTYVRFREEEGQRVENLSDEQFVAECQAEIDRLNAARPLRNRCPWIPADPKPIAAMEASAPPARRFTAQELLDELMAVAKLRERVEQSTPDGAMFSDCTEAGIYAEYASRERALLRAALAGVEPPRRGPEFL